MRGATSKERLISATIEAIYISGLHSVTTSKISKKANLSEAMIYKNFGNKDEMIVEAFMWIKKELNIAVESILDSNKSFNDQCYNIWFAHIDFFIQNHKYLRVISQFEHSNYMTDEIRKKCFRLIDSVIIFFNNGMNTGVFKEMDIEVAIALFFSPILSISESIIEGRLVKSEKLLTFVFDSTMSALCKRLPNK